MLLDGCQAADPGVVGKRFVVGRDDALRVRCADFFERFVTQVPVHQNVGFLSPVDHQRLDQADLSDGSVDRLVAPGVFPRTFQRSARQDGIQREGDLIQLKTQ